MVFGIGGMSFSAGEFTLKGVGLAGVLGVFLNLVLPQERQETGIEEESDLRKST